MRKIWKNTFNSRTLTNKEQSIIGTLNPIHWDKEDDVDQFSIYSDEEEDIIIEEFHNKKRLSRLINKRVLARGKIRIDENGEKHIKLKMIKELSPPTAPAVRLSNPITARFWSEEYSLLVPTR
ncbi:MAG: hypothetical protein COV37_05930 [Bdellovibrio sp. CG11_big_fil_rev_8_21_14_0_20_39_38]|nr:MAG: hypothetical protein COV37_05930 [Bdellovibrio sp. CG11_big_fil_rev_8_21_14_0_20_39_38]